MRWIYTVGAELTLILHFVWIVFVVGGVFLLRRRRRRWRLVHLAAVVYSVAIEIFGWICPLTYLEQWFLKRAGRGSYAGDFITHYVEKLIYLSAPQWLLVSLAVLLLVVTAALYLWPEKPNGSIR